jgi:dTMP kinase
MDPLTEALIMFAARREHLMNVIEPALAQGQVVLCDRFTDATFAYQGGGRGFDWQVLQSLERMVQQVPAIDLRQPDLTIWFDLSPQVAAERLSSARVPDKFESQPVAFFDNVRSGYAKRMAESPSRFVQIAAEQTREAVWLDVLNSVQSVCGS